ncbi:MAG: FAD-dependent oxidoreductase, partial [Thermoproteota archaeon]
MAIRVAIVGGGAAGMATASRVKRLLGDRAEVLVFEKGRWVSFALCGTPYFVGCTVKTLDQLIHYPLEEFTRKRGIKVKLETRVLDIDPDARRLKYRELASGNEDYYEYDYLVLATGAKPKIPRDWSELLAYENFFVLHSLEDANKMRKYVVDSSVKRVLIVGAGYIGYELSENLKALGKEVVLVEMLNHVLPAMLDEDIAELAAQPLKENGVQLLLGQGVQRFEVEGGRVRRAILSSGESLDADAFIAAIGIAPNVELASRAGLRIGETGAIWTDSRMRTSREDTYAVGDAAETTDLVTGKRVW